jgi:hypothetical protein
MEPRKAIKLTILTFEIFLLIIMMKNEEIIKDDD